MIQKKFSHLVSTAVPFDRENIDTDQIIPARFLKATTRDGFGENLFRDWRFDDQGRPIAGFVLNDSRYRGKILVAGKNFGCGSSREHAAWALKDYGFEVVVSSFFADIFRGNALNNSILPVVVPEPVLQELLGTITRDAGTLIEVDLSDQYIRILPAGDRQAFDIDPYKKECLLQGMDDIEYLLHMKPEVVRYESTHSRTF